MPSDYTREFPGRTKKKDLEAQLGRLVVYADNHRLTIVQAVSKVGSGLNGRRPKLIKLLANPKIQTMVVEHRDRFNALRRRVCRGRPYRPGAQAPGHGKLRGQR